MTAIGELPRTAAAALLLCCLSPSACSPKQKSAPAPGAAENAALKETIRAISTGSKALFLPPGYLALLPKEASLRLPLPGQAAEACLSPSSFHALNRTLRFDTVFLAPGPYCTPLRDDLLTSPLWVLSDIRPEGYLFRITGSPAWHPPDAGESAGIKPDPLERSVRLTCIAENLIAIGRGEEAQALLTQASGSKGNEARRLEVLASLEAVRGHWEKALKLSKESLRINPSGRAPRMILVRSLAETGQTDEALDQARSLAREHPDAETYFLLARAANAAGDHAGEIAALRRLVEVGKKDRQPVGASLLYLGQALARDGQRGDALRCLEEAERAPELTEEQRRLIRELRDHLAPARDTN